MTNIFYLYSNSKLVKTFAQLNTVVSYINNTNTDMKLFAIYVEERNDDLDCCSIRTLLYKNSMFEIDNIFNYY